MLGDRLVSAVLLIGLPVVFLSSDNSFYQSVLIYTAINAVAAIGLCLVFGLAGQISLAQAAFVGLGAYVTTLASNRLSLEGLLAILLGGAVSMVAGWAVSRPLSRLHEHYLAMGTLAFGIVASILYSNLGAITGGLDPGVTISRFRVLGWALPRSSDFFWVCWGFLVAATTVASNLAVSKVGLSLRAIKMSEAAAESVGVDARRGKALVFSLGALFAGISGGLYAYYVRSFNASSFGFAYSIDLLMMIIVGSFQRVSGAILGALIVTVLPLALDQAEEWKTLIFGVLMVAVVKYAPTGLIDTLVAVALRGGRRLRWAAGR